jgi:imidazolonepropionase-like amidohydrolase
VSQLALMGGSLVDVRTGSIRPNTTLLIRDDRIAAVGPSDGFPIPADAQAVNVSGTWLLPGLFDMHTHATGAQLDRPKEKLLHLFLAYGVTSVRDTGGNLTQLRLLRDDLAAGRKLGPRLFFAGPILEGLPPVWPSLSVLVDTTQRACSAVEFLADQGVDFIKVYNWVPEDSLRVVIETAHARGLRVTGHVPRTITMTRAIELGMDCLEHIRVTGREMLPLDEAAPLDALPVARRETLLWQRFALESEPFERLVQRLADSGVYLDATLLVDASLCLDGREIDLDNPANADVPPEVRDSFIQAPVPAIFELSQVERALARDGFRRRQRFVAMCHAAGVRLLAGTDCYGLGKLLPGLGLQNELALLVDAGLTPLAAIQAATITAAEALGQPDLGVLEPGKLADVVVLEGDPLADIQNARRTRLVVKNGQVHEVAALRSHGLAGATP